MDNTVFHKKVAIRRFVLDQVCGDPLVMETHGGTGRLFNACYSHIPRGVVFEKSPSKAALLLAQRPNWLVYSGDCARGLAAGAGKHIAVNFLDIDPYGSPWPVLDAFLFSARPRPPRLWIVVTDGLRHSLTLATGWRIHYFKSVVRRFGNNLFEKYLDVCAALVDEKASQAGYRLDAFDGYYCGSHNYMTHYYAALSSS